jgi:SP family sugar:H+ symporter-like MFS transporter
MLFMNESPRWLVEKNRITDAAKALARVRGKPADDPEVIQELDEIIQDFNGHEKMPLMAQIRAAGSSKKMFYRTSFGIILMFWQQWTGTNSINYYAPQIFKQIGLVGKSSGLFAVGIYGVVKIVMTAIGLMAFTEQLGRKWSLIIGSVGQAFSMYYIGVNSAVHPPNGVLDSNSIFAIVCVYLFVVFYSFGKPMHTSIDSSSADMARLGSYALHPQLRVQPQPRPLADHGGVAHDTVALQLHHREDYAHHAGEDHIRHVLALWVALHRHGHLGSLLRAGDQGSPARVDR